MSVGSVARRPPLFRRPSGRGVSRRSGDVRRSGPARRSEGFAAPEVPDVVAPFGSEAA